MPALDILSYLFPPTDIDCRDPISLNHEAAKRAFKFLIYDKRHRQEAQALKQWYEVQVMPVIVQRLKISTTLELKPPCEHGRKIDCQTCETGVLDLAMMLTQILPLFDLPSRMDNGDAKLESYPVERYLMRYSQLQQWQQVPSSRPWYRKYPEMLVDWEGEEETIGKLIG